YFPLHTFGQSQHDVERLRGDVLAADLHVNRINIKYRIASLQRSLAPSVKLVGKLLVKAADGRRAIMGAIYFLGDLAHLSGGQSFPVELKTEPALLLLLVPKHRPQDRLKVAETITGNPQA